MTWLGAVGLVVVIIVASVAPTRPLALSALAARTDGPQRTAAAHPDGRGPTNHVPDRRNDDDE